MTYTEAEIQKYFEILRSYTKPPEKTRSKDLLLKLSRN